MKVFVDLEETLIISWTSPVPLVRNIQEIRHLCISKGVTSITIFSLAILDNRDKKTFFERILPLFDSILDLEVDVITMEEIRDIICCGTCLNFKLSEWSDVFAFNGKMQPFIEMIRASDDEVKENETFVLIDDKVENMDIHLKDTNTKIQFIRVENEN